MWCEFSLKVSGIYKSERECIRRTKAWHLGHLDGLSPRCKVNRIEYLEDTLNVKFKFNSSMSMRIRAPVTKNLVLFSRVVTFSLIQGLAGEK